MKESGNKSVLVRLQDETGSVLMWAVVMSLCIVLSGISYLLLSNQLNKLYVWDSCRSENIYAMNTGLRTGIHNFRGTRPTGPQGTFWDELYGTSRYGYGVSPNGRGSYGLSAWSNYIIWGMGSTASPGDGFTWTDSISYGYGAQSFADYLWITNDERNIITGDSIFWWAHDTLDGKVHSNGYLYISANQTSGPVFLKTVSTCKDNTSPPTSAYNWQLVFRGGLITNAPRIIFPDQADSVRCYAHGDYLIGHQSTAPTKQYYIRFFDGNTFKVLESNRGQAFDTSDAPGHGWQASGVTPRRIPIAGAVFVYGKLFIDAPKYVANGNLVGIDGRLTIASSDTIIVLHDIFYTCSDSAGRVPLNCNDALGLISEKWLLMSKDCGAPLYPNRGSLVVNAAIAALRGSMAIENINLAPEYSSLMIHGCIAQLNRGIIHRGAAGFGHGFVEKDYSYDQRFASLPPPHFIPTGTYKEFYVE